MLNTAKMVGLGFFLVLGCTKTTEVIETVDASSTGGGSGTQANTTGGTTTGGSTTGGQATGGSTTGGTTTGNTGGETEGGETTAQETTGSTTGGSVEVCGITDHPGKAIGEPCTEHDECETGYCYDEYFWNEDGSQTYRFCTAACTSCTTVGNCNEWGKAAGTQENKCIPLTSSFLNYYGDIKAESLCLASCQSDADCAGMGPFTKCALPYFGKDYNYGVQKMCQPPEFPKLDEKEF